MNFLIRIFSIRLCCDREIIDDSNELHSRLSDLSKMNHVVTQFNENGNLLGEFIRQIDKLKIKTDDIIRVSAQMPRDAELLEARYESFFFYY
jgi:23S rRNA maturation-related 3'-5' exoribonuclease YhaM